MANYSLEEVVPLVVHSLQHSWNAKIQCCLTDVQLTCDATRTLRMAPEVAKWKGYIIKELQNLKAMQDKDKVIKKHQIKTRDL